MLFLILEFPRCFEDWIIQRSTYKILKPISILMLGCVFYKAAFTLIYILIVYILLVINII